MCILAILLCFYLQNQELSIYFHFYFFNVPIYFTNNQIQRVYIVSFYIIRILHSDITNLIMSSSISFNIFFIDTAIEWIIISFPFDILLVSFSFNYIFYPKYFLICFLQFFFIKSFIKFSFFNLTNEIVSNLTYFI